MLDSPPPTSELFTLHQLEERHPHLLSFSRLAWAVRHRSENGLNTKAAKAVFQSKGGELLVHEPAFLRWFLGLDGRAKPRSLRRPNRAARRHDATAA